MGSSKRTFNVPYEKRVNWLISVCLFTGLRRKVSQDASGGDTQQRTLQGGWCADMQVTFNMQEAQSLTKRFRSDDQQSSLKDDTRKKKKKYTKKCESEK